MLRSATLRYIRILTNPIRVYIRIKSNTWKNAEDWYNSMKRIFMRWDMKLSYCNVISHQTEKKGYFPKLSIIFPLGFLWMFFFLTNQISELM